MASRRARLVALVVAVAAGAGCTGIPSSSPARTVRRVPAEGAEPIEPRAERRLPPRPPADATPDEVVRSFLIAQSQPPDDYAVARRYLAPQTAWDADARALVYAARRPGAARISGNRATVVVTVDAIGEISPTGEYRPRSAPVELTFALRQLPNVGWRISDVPPGLIVERNSVATSFLRATIYWPDQARRLVPDPVFLRSDEQPVGAIVRALLAGPRSWLGPAVRSAIPEGTELLALPEIVDGVVTLNFSREIRGAARDTIGTLVAQIVWTLTERPEVRAVRLLSENDPLVVPDRPGRVEFVRADWPNAGPVPPTASRQLFFLRNGVPYALDDAGRLSRPLARTARLESFAVNRSETTLAGVTRPVDGRRSLVLVDLTGEDPDRTILTADRITPPTWEPGGDVVWVVQSNGGSQQVVTVPTEGGLFRVGRVPSALPSPVTALRLSPDGARAVLVAGSARSASLWLARIERPASGGPVLGGALRIGPAVRGVTAAAFDGATHLLFAAVAGRRPALYRVAVDGFRLEVLRDQGLPAERVSALAVSAGLPADRVAASAGRLWRRTPGADWAPLAGRGSAPAFAG